MPLTPTQARQLIGPIRASFALAWLQPTVAAKLFGFKRAADTDVALPYLVRLFGARDGALGALTILAPAERRKQVLTVGLAVDAADFLAGVAMFKDKRVPRTTAILCSGAAVMGIVLGLLARQEK